MFIVSFVFLSDGNNYIFSNVVSLVRCDLVSFGLHLDCANPISQFTMLTFPCSILFYSSARGCSFATETLRQRRHPSVTTDCAKENSKLTLQNPLLDQCLRTRSVLQLLLQTVRTHMFRQFALLALECRRHCAVGEDIAWFNVSRSITII